VVPGTSGEEKKEISKAHLENLFRNETCVPDTI
jgi:hypothetical protein